MKEDIIKKVLSEMIDMTSKGVGPDVPDIDRWIDALEEATMEDRKDWKMSEWNQMYSTVPLPPMTNEEIQAGIAFLRGHNYPKPTDCPEQECPKYRPACQLGICRIAVGMCGDF